MHAVNNNGLQPLRASTPSDAQHASSDAGTRVKYYLHRHNDNPSNLVGSAIFSDIDLCPPFNPITNTNGFGHYFGIEFMHNGHTYVRAISPFEFVLCFCLTDELTMHSAWTQLSPPAHQHGFLRYFSTGASTFAAATSKSLSQSSLLPLQPEFRHSSMTPLVSAYHRQNNGHRLTWTIQRQMQ